MDQTNGKDVETTPLTEPPKEAINFLREQDLAAGLFLTSTERSIEVCGKEDFYCLFSVWSGRRSFASCCLVIIAEVLIRSLKIPTYRANFLQCWYKDSV